MRLRTRVLSFMLAGSMMLSATPISAFAQTNHTESPISTIADISNDQSVLTASASNQTYTIPMLVAADNVTFTNCTFEQGVSVAGNNVQFINCIVKSFESTPLSVATLNDYIALLQSQGHSYTVSDFSAITNPEAASLILNGGTYDNSILGLSGALTITGNGTFTNKIAIVNSNTTIESGTFTGPVAAVTADVPLKIKGGLFSPKLAGWSSDSNVYKIQAPDTTFDSTSHPSFKNQYGFFYVATSSNFEPTIKMVYNGADGTHQIATWRLEMTNSNENYHKVGYADEADYAAKLQLADYQADDVKTTIQFKCIDNYNGYRPIHGDIQLDPVYAMNASDLTFTAPSSEQKAAVTSKLADAPQLTLSYYNIDDNTSSDTYPTKAGTYQVKAVSSETKYFADGSTYYKVTAGDEFTSDSWQFTIEAGIDTNGKPTVSETNDWTYDSNTGENGTLTVKENGSLDLGDTTLTTDVTNNGTIKSGTFAGNVTGGTITGGVFATEPTGTTSISSKAKVTVTGGATVNNLKNDETGENRSSTVTVVTGKEQTIHLSAKVAGHDLIGWKATEGDSDLTLTRESSITIGESDETARTFTPVVQAIQNDLEMLDVTTGSEQKYYLLDADGDPTGDGFDVLPEDAGTYAKFVELVLPTTSIDEVNSIALYAANDVNVLDRVVEKNGIGYYVPKLLKVEGTTTTVGSPDAATGSGDSGAGGAAVAVIGGAAIGGAAYLIGTQVYLTSVLPEGASIPTNRQQLADLLWTAAGKPQPASTALFTDISAEAADSQKAARWCVEQGLLKDTGSTFKPDKHTFRPQVIKAWNDLQAKLNPQK